MSDTVQQYLYGIGAKQLNLIVDMLF